MVQAKSSIGEKQTPYATSGDFCRIFAGDMSGLYLLGLLLTGDEKRAEECFISSLQDTISGGPVFKEWARSWARRTVVCNAVRILSPKPGHRGQGDGVEQAMMAVRKLDSDGGYDPPLTALLALSAFDRFVFIITVLEKMREHECSLLLGCSLREVIAARRRVLETLAHRSGTRDQAREFLQPAQVA